MLLWNTVKFAHMALRLVPKILNPVDMIFLVCKELRMVDAEMLELRYIQYIVAAPTVGINNAIWHHLALNNRE